VFPPDHAGKMLALPRLCMAWLGVPCGARGQDARAPSAQVGARASRPRGRGFAWLHSVFPPDHAGKMPAFQSLQWERGRLARAAAAWHGFTRCSPRTTRARCPRSQSAQGRAVAAWH